MKSRSTLLLLAAAGITFGLMKYYDSKFLPTRAASLKASLTWDRGSEMTQHADFTLATKMALFF